MGAMNACTIYGRRRRPKSDTIGAAAKKTFNVMLAGAEAASRLHAGAQSVTLLPRSHIAAGP